MLLRACTQLPHTPSSSRCYLLPRSHTPICFISHKLSNFKFRIHVDNTSMNFMCMRHCWRRRDLILGMNYNIMERKTSFNEMEHNSLKNIGISVKSISEIHPLALLGRRSIIYYPKKNIHVCRDSWIQNITHFTVLYT